MEVGDAGEYSCEMTEKEENSDKTREYVTVSVFERESVEEVVLDEEEESADYIHHFIGPVDVKNSEYTKYEHKKLIPPISMTSSYSNSHVVCASKYIFTLITWIHVTSNMIGSVTM